MPKNGMDMTEGVLVRWLKQEGERVEAGEPIMEIQTDKISMEAEAPASGILLKQLFGEDEIIPVLTTVGYIGEEGDVIPDGSAPVQAAAPAAEEAPAAAVPAAAPVQPPAPAAGSVAATPYAKFLAVNNGLDLSGVQPSGSMGEIKAQDMGSACISISNMGMFGTYYFTPIINQPEASILGVCAIEDELALVNGEVTVKKVSLLATTFDHRILNGTEAAKFQADLKALLENPLDILV